MGLPQQSHALLKTARHLANKLPADAVLVVTETPLDWAALHDVLHDTPFLVAAARSMAQKLRDLYPDLTVLEFATEQATTQERIATALLKATALGKLQPGAHVVVVYNGIADEEDRPEPVDTVSVIHLGDHLERFTAADLRKLNSPVPLEVLRLVVDLATEIGREGREGKPVGTLLVVGDTKRVFAMSRSINFNPFKGYSRSDRDLRDRRVREQIKDLAQLDGAILIGRDGIAVAGCMYIDVPADGIVLGKGLGSRHVTAAAVSARTSAVGVVVSQSSGAVRLFQGGEEVLHIEPLARPHIWQPFRLETEEGENGLVAAKPKPLPADRDA